MLTWFYSDILSDVTAIDLLQQTKERYIETTVIIYFPCHLICLFGSWDSCTVEKRISQNCSYVSV
jgi:hypothetical protein